MTPSTRPSYHLDLGNLPSLIPNQTPSTKSSAATSPIERPMAASQRPGPAVTGSLAGLGGSGSSLTGTGSPGIDYGNRLYGKSRTRELQGSDKPSPSMWGPPTASGLSTPLRETIPESPGSDSFPDLGSTSSDSAPFASIKSRSRAGTVPSRLPLASGQQSLFSKTSRPSPTSSPFQPGESPPSGFAPFSSNTALLSRLRAGSTPQRPSLLSSASPFGPSIFSSGWNTGRNRANSANSLNAADEIQGSSKDQLDGGIKTLDYLGLVETPQQDRGLDGTNTDNIFLSQRPAAPYLASLAALNRSANRFRSYSVNAKEKYAADEDSDVEPAYYGGTLTPTAEAAAAAMAATQAQIHQHNLEVQAFANQSSSSRPRARTAGVLDSPSARVWGNYRQNSSLLDNQYGHVELDSQDGFDMENLSNALRAAQLSSTGLNSQDDPMEANTVDAPTRALWLGGIPASTTPSSLTVIFEPFGKIESVRVLTYKSCGFVNFEKTENATRAKAQLNGKELFPGAGPIRISFGRPPSSTATPQANGIFMSPSPDPFTQTSSEQPPTLAANGSRAVSSYLNDAVQDASISASEVPQLQDVKSDLMQVVKELGASEEEQTLISATIENAISSNVFEPEISPIPEPTPNRIHDAPRLREFRKRIDNNSCSQEEIEEIAMGMLPEISELSSDYLGNTVVQKLFEYCRENVKEAMLQEIAPHLAEIGVHKNGTWAAQKIIDVARTGLQMSMIVEHLRPYGVASFLDQYGNYVMQCCLRFGTPWNNFIFETMLSRLWEIAQGRFGARAMRACLESHYAGKEHQRILAAAIALHSVQLATNANGALLLTWFLDTCNFPHRRAVLAPRIVPHLVHLCTHKVAYLTVLKIINQRNEPEARDAILQALFFSANDETLEEILKDQACGATLIFKVLTTPFFDDQLRPEVVQNIRKVLLKLKVQPSQGYKRLMDEVELSTKGQSSVARDPLLSGGDAPRCASKQNNAPQLNQARQASFNGQFTGLSQQQAEMLQPRSANMELSNSFDPFNHQTPNAPNPQLFAANGNITPHSPMNANQLPYQPAFFGAQRQPSGYMAPAALNGYPSAYPASMDPYRGMPGAAMTPQIGINPMVAPGGYNQSGFNPMIGLNGGMAGPAVWQQQYQNMYMMPQHQQVQSQAMMGGGRRGRR